MVDFGEISVKLSSNEAQKYLDRTQFFLSWNLIRILQGKEKLPIGRFAAKNSAWPKVCHMEGGLREPGENGAF